MIAAAPSAIRRGRDPFAPEGFVERRYVDFCFPPIQWTLGWPLGSCAGRVRVLMGVSVTVCDQSSTGRVSGGLTLSDISAATTLRELIRTRVREEVARYNAGPTPVFDGLVMPEGASPAREGFAMPRPRPIDWERQAGRAIESFGRNGFLVLVDDRQVLELDEELGLTADSDVRFVRLVPLVGG